MTASPIPIDPWREGFAFQVKVLPRSSANGLRGITGDALKVAVTSPPEKGKANSALLKLLSRVLEIPTSSLDIVSGASSRTKKIGITGVTREALSRALTLATDEPPSGSSPGSENRSRGLDGENAPLTR